MTTLRSFLSLLLLAVMAISFNTPVSFAASSDRPFLSSIIPLLLNSTNLRKTDREITLYPERSHLAIAGDRNRVLYTVSLQPNPTAPLIFISPGLGGYAINSTTQFMAELAYNAGYSVISLPSTTHWTFAIAASRNGRVGYLPNDAKDLYSLIKAIKNQVITSAGLRPSEYGLIGYSYGGLDSAFLAAEDTKQKVFNFSFVVALNPPLQRQVALNKVDQYFNLGDSWTEEYKFKILSYVTGKYMDFADMKPSPRMPPLSLDFLASQFTLSESKISWVIANMFRDSLKNSAHVGALISGQNIETEDAIIGPLGTYLQDNVYNTVSRDSTMASGNISQDSELTTAMSIFTNNFVNKNNFVLFHSTDDFLTFPEGQAVLNSLNVEKHIYGFGGHLGYLIDPTVQADLTRVLLSHKK